MIAYKLPDDDDAIFCALFESFTARERPYMVFKGAFQLSFDCRVKTISVIPKNVERVKKGIIKCGGISLLSTIYYALRSQDELKETIIFNAIYKCLSERKNLLDNFKDPDMLALFDLKSKIGNETHRMKGFIRFEKTASGIWYSHFSPDNNVVDLVAPHFKERFPKEKFIIHDTRRNIFSVYNGKDILTFKSDQPITIYLDKEEIEFQGLWQTYFNSVNIKERKNTRLQDNSLPRRYRVNMSEFLAPLDNEILSPNNFNPVYLNDLIE